MQALKVLVAVMGALIIVAVGLVTYGLVMRLSGDRAGSPGLGEVPLTVPAGCVIAGAQTDGGHLIVRTDGPAERGCQQIVVIDLTDGTILGRVKAVPSP